MGVGVGMGMMPPPQGIDIGGPTMVGTLASYHGLHLLMIQGLTGKDPFKALAR